MEENNKVKLNVLLTPIGATADTPKTSIPIQELMFRAKADMINNIVRIGDIQYSLSSMEFEVVKIPPPVETEKV